MYGALTLQRQFYEGSRAAKLNNACAIITFCDASIKHKLKGFKFRLAVALYQRQTKTVNYFFELS